MPHSVDWLLEDDKQLKLFHYATEAEEAYEALPDNPTKEELQPFIDAVKKAMTQQPVTVRKQFADAGAFRNFWGSPDLKQAARRVLDAIDDILDNYAALKAVTPEGLIQPQIGIPMFSEALDECVISLGGVVENGQLEVFDTSEADPKKQIVKVPVDSLTVLTKDHGRKVALQSLEEYFPSDKYLENRGRGDYLLMLQSGLEPEWGSLKVSSHKKVYIDGWYARGFYMEYGHLPYYWPKELDYPEFLQDIEIWVTPAAHLEIATTEDYVILESESSHIIEASDELDLRELFADEVALLDLYHPKAVEAIMAFAELTNLEDVSYAEAVIPVGTSGDIWERYVMKREELEYHLGSKSFSDEVMSMEVEDTKGNVFPLSDLIKPETPPAPSPEQFESIVEELLREDTLDTFEGDAGNLIAILRVDTDEDGNYWETHVYIKDQDRIVDVQKFRSEAEARRRFEEIKREF